MLQKLLRTAAGTVVAAGGMLVVAPEAVADQTTVYVVGMSGAEVVESAGDPDGFGTATITVDHRTEEVCVAVDTTNLELPLLSVIVHEGAAGEPNGAATVVWNTDGYDPDPVSCRADVNGFGSFKELWKRIGRDPAGFHLTVRNYAYPDDGAIRGQLALAGT